MYRQSQEVKQRRGEGWNVIHSPPEYPDDVEAWNHGGVGVGGSFNLDILSTLTLGYQGKAGGQDTCRTIQGQSHTPQQMSSSDAGPTFLIISYSSHGALHTLDDPSVSVV